MPPKLEEYRKCMVPFISGQGKTKEQRKLDFCAGSKLCSHKASSREEANKICRSQPPKPPKVRGARRVKGVVPCEQDAAELAGCMVNVVSYPLPKNRQELQQNIFNAIHECRCQGKGA